MQERSLEGKVGELVGTYQGLLREVALMREQTERNHAENRRNGEERNQKLDMLLGLKPMVDEHDEWIKSRGEPTAKRVDGTYATGKGVLIGATLGGGAIGAVAMKVMAVLASAFSHG